MPEIQVQQTPEPEQGAQSPLKQERTGAEFDQNQMSRAIGRGTEVTASSQPNEKRFQKGEINGVSGRAESCTSNGLAVSGRAEEYAKHVDQKCVEGSYPGDTRQRGADAQLPPNPAPREPKGQALTPKGA